MPVAHAAFHAMVVKASMTCTLRTIPSTCAQRLAQHGMCRFLGPATFSCGCLEHVQHTMCDTCDRAAGGRG
jgi:hypothetical protein